MPSPSVKILKLPFLSLSLLPSMELGSETERILQLRALACLQNAEASS